MDYQKWVILPLLYLLPVGVFSLAILSPEHRPVAIQFAEISFGAALAEFGRKASEIQQSQRNTRRIGQANEDKET